jgi:hypothetical protein
MSADALNKDGNKSSSKSDKSNTNDSSEGAGRKEKADDEKSDKTIANKESMN